MSIIDPRTGNPMTAEPTAENVSADGERPPVTAEEVIIELNAGNIQQVLEASMQVPVLMCCYSPADDSSSKLATILEKLAIEYAGAFLLGKLDAQSNPEISAQLGVRSVPDVKLISQGGLVDSLQEQSPRKKFVPGSAATFRHPRKLRLVRRKKPKRRFWKATRPPLAISTRTW